MNNTPIRRITGATASRVAQWYERAYNDPQIMRFMSCDPAADIPTAFDSDWAHIVLMDDSGNGMASVWPCRAAGNFYSTLMCYVFPCENKKYIAGRLIDAAFEQGRSVGSKYMDWAVHGTNVDSLYLSDRIAQKVGVRPEGAWDRYLSKWVDSHAYRKNISR